ncbi:MAG: P-loop NTPase family protein [Myxococcales bacterium]
MTLGSEARRSNVFLRPDELIARRPGVLATGLPALDRLLGGGIPVGRITELRGAAGGRTAIALHAAARLTAQGRPVAWVDGPGALDPRSAAGLGVDLRGLLWVRLPPAQLAGACDALVRGGAFGLVVLDLLSLPERRWPGAAAWVRLARAVEAARASLLSLGSSSGREAAALALRRVRASYVGSGPGRLLQGFSAEVELVHNKLGLPPATAKLEWRAPDPFTPPKER